jgi:hypothetical protein
MTETEYQALIPDWCLFPTAKLHWDMLGLCWGVTSNKISEDYCLHCEFNLQRINAMPTIPSRTDGKVKI